MLMKENYLSEDQGIKIVLHLSTKYHIEMICVEAKRLDFDVILGCQVYRQSKFGEKLKQP